MLKRGLNHSLTAIITGASSGIGKALALSLSKNYKANIVINARSEESLEQTKKEVENFGGKAITISGDISTPSLPGKIVETCLSHFSDIDLLINNAGLTKPGSLLKLTPEDWEKVFAVNFFGPLRLTYEVLPHFVKKKGGKIINISSVAGKVALPGSVCYAASKFALTGMSEGMAAELASYGIDVLTVCPGWVRTEFFEKNHMSNSRNPTLIAQKNDIRGLLMRHILSISSEKAAQEILTALDNGHPSEIVLTTPGIIAERFAGLCPSLFAKLSRAVPF